MRLPWFLRRFLDRRHADAIYTRMVDGTATVADYNWMDARGWS